MSSERIDGYNELHDIGESSDIRDDASLARHVVNHGPKKAPAWKYFDDLDPANTPTSHGRKRYRCKFCRDYQTHHATRARHHLLGNILKGDAPPCQGLYGHVDLHDINRMYNILKTPPKLR